MHFQTYDEYKASKPADKGASSCPFCNKNDREIRNNKDWRIIYPIKPIGGVKRRKANLMLIPKRHIESETELTDTERLSRREGELWLEQYFKKMDIDYFCVTRMTSQIKSILHLHTHYVGGTISYRFLNESVEAYDIKYNKNWST